MTENKNDSGTGSVMNIKFSKYEPPVFKEVKTGQLVLYGKNANDLYPDYVIGLYEKSPTHKACIDTKHRFLFGGGWTVDTSVMTQGEAAMYMEMIKRINESGESLNDVTDKCGWDFLNLGALAIEVIYGKGSRKKWTGLNFVPVSQVRELRVNDKGDIKYCFLPNWKGVTSYDAAKTKEGFREWFPFGTKDNPAESELFYYKSFRPLKSGESGAYALPSYAAAIPWIEVDSRTGVFHLNNIKNNFAVGTLINFFNGDPTPEKKAEILKDLKNHFAGENADETGGIMASFNKPGTTPVSIDRMQAGDQDKLYLQVDTFARQKIVTTNNVPLSLLNIPLEGVMFDRNTVQKDFEHFEATYVDPTQRIFERIINHLMEFNGLKPLFRLKKVKPLGIQFSEAMIEKYMPADVMTHMIAESLGVNIKETQQKLIFSKREEVETWFTFELSDTANTDEAFRTMHFAKVLDIDLSGFDGDLISLIAKNPTITPEALAVGLKKSLEKVQERLSYLIDNKVFSGKIGDLKITKVAENTLKEEDIALDIQVRYFYVGPDDDRTRDWCHERLKNQPANGYTFEQVQALTPSEANYDGNNFNNRGGWWTRKDGKTTTFCRHKWEARTVRIK